MSRSGSPYLRQPLLQPSDDDALDHTPTQQPCWAALLSTNSRFLLQCAATMCSFVVLGMFTSSIGVMLPHIEAFYHLNDVQASACFLAGPTGYVIAAHFNHAIHHRYGRRGIAIVGPVAQLVAAAGTAMHPPFLVLLACITLAFAGAGFLDGSWCTWAAGQKSPSFVSGLLHGSFSIGAGCGPMLIELILSHGQPWYTWYKVLACICILELLILSCAFMSDNTTKLCEPDVSESPGQSHTTSRQVFAYKALWICACFLLIQVGTESAISGWVVTYMLRVRQSSQKMASMCSSAFWTGMAVSRIVLGFVSDKFGVRKTTVIYICCALISQTLFVAVQGQILSAMLIALVGFFCGPLFPSAIIRLTQLLPPAMGVQAVSFVASIGQLGAALLPFGLGALSHLIGLGVFGVVIIAQFAVCLALWMVFS